MDDTDDAITRLLAPDGAGARPDASELLPLVYDQLRKAAAIQLAREPQGHTLQPTALVHEAFVKLAGPRQIPWANRGHYYAAAAQAMRQILIDHARSKGARKAREGAPPSVPDIAALSAQDSGTILAVDEALTRLESEDPEAAAIVRLRFFAGLSVEQAATVTNTSPRTAARLWSYARARLHSLLTESGQERGHE